MEHICHLYLPMNNTTSTGFSKSNVAASRNQCRLPAKLKSFTQKMSHFLKIFKTLNTRKINKYYRTPAFFLLFFSTTLQSKLNITETIHHGTIFYEDGQGNAVNENGRPEPMDHIVDQNLYALESLNQTPRICRM